MSTQNLQLTNEWDKTFPKSEKRRYKKDRGIWVDYINMTDFVPTMKSLDK